MIEETQTKLSQVELLFDNGQFTEAIESLESIPISDCEEIFEKTTYLLLKCKLQNQLRNYEVALKIAQELSKKIPELGTSQLILEISIALATSFWRLTRYDDALEVVHNAKRMLDSIEKTPIESFNQNKALLYHLAGTTHWSKGEFDIALDYLENSLKLRKKLGNKQDIASSLNNIGLICWSKGNFDSALKYLKQSLQLKNKFGDRSAVARTLNNIGSVYLKKGDLDQALKMYLQSFSIRKELGNEIEIASSLMNIGNLHQMRSDKQSLEYYKQCLEILEKIGNTKNIAYCINNMGNDYRDLGDLNQALDCYQKGLAFFEKLDSKQDIAGATENVANIFLLKGKLSKALEFHQRCLSLRQRIGNSQEIASSLKNISTVYHQKGELDLAVKYLRDCYNLEEEIGNVYPLSNTLVNLISVMISIDAQEFKQHLSIDQVNETTHFYFNKLENIFQSNPDKIIFQRFLFAQALLLRNKETEVEKIEAQQIFEKISQEAIEHELAVLALVNLCDISLEKFIFTGNQNVKSKLEEQIESILKIAQKGQLLGVILTIHLLKGKLGLLTLKEQMAEQLFQQVISQSQELGYEFLEKQSKKELQKLKKYDTIDIIVEKMQTTIEKRLQKEEQADILNYLRDIAIQFQRFDNK